MQLPLIFILLTGQVPVDSLSLAAGPSAAAITCDGASVSLSADLSGCASIVLTLTGGPNAQVTFTSPPLPDAGVLVDAGAVPDAGVPPLGCPGLSMTNGEHFEAFMGRTRRYYVAVPSVPGPFDALLAFHGGGGDIWGGMTTDTGILNGPWSLDGKMLIVPEHFDPTSFWVDAEAENIAFVQALLTCAGEQHFMSGDVQMVGFSAGAAMALSLMPVLDAQLTDVVLYSGAHLFGAPWVSSGGRARVTVVSGGSNDVYFAPVHTYVFDIEGDLVQAQLETYGHSVMRCTHASGHTSPPEAHDMTWPPPWPPIATPFYRRLRGESPAMPAYCQ